MILRHREGQLSIKLETNAQHARYFGESVTFLDATGQRQSSGTVDSKI